MEADQDPTADELPANEAGQTAETRTAETDTSIDSESPKGESADSSPSKSPGVFRFFGPGFLVAAAFIGPGTVNTSIRAGGNYGFQLLWAVLFAGLATVVFQGMAARLGLVSRKGLAESLREFFKNDQLRQAALFLVIAAIIFGNTAYQAGNLSGAAKGLYHFVPMVPSQVWLLICSGLAFFIIWTGTLKSLKIILSSLVVLMSLTFLVAAMQSRPNFPELMAGCFSFEVFDIAVVFALIGTTVVPYNLFLHSSSIAEQNAHIKVKLDSADSDASGDEETSSQSDGQVDSRNPSAPDEPSEIDYALAGSTLDTWIAVWIGAVVTGAIVVTAAGTNATNFDEAAAALTDLIGGFGKALFFVGLFAAGLTSAITAPLAAGYVYAGCFGFPAKANGEKVRQIAAVIVVVGYLVAAVFGSSPGQVIFVAQVANGMILPLIAIFLIVVMNSKKLLGQYRNHWQQNVLGGLIVLFVVILGLFKLGTLLGIVS